MGNKHRIAINEIVIFIKDVLPLLSKLMNIEKGREDKSLYRLIINLRYSLYKKRKDIRYLILTVIDPLDRKDFYDHIWETRIEKTTKNFPKMFASFQEFHNRVQEDPICDESLRLSSKTLGLFVGIMDYLRMDILIDK